nr:nuclear envelope pore membrane protein POM 121C-like isoform X2 [Manis javanica]
MREEDGPQGSGSSAPPANKESQGEQDTTTCREQNWDSPPTPSSSQPHRRKFPLVPSRRGIPLISPPAPWIGRSITVEEHYQEKQAQSQWLKRIFEDKTAITSGFGAVTQPTSCGTRTSGFGSTVSAPFTSMVSAGPTGSGGFGTRVPAPHSSPTTGAFGCGSGQSGRSGLKNPFWGALKPSSLDGAGQSTPSAFHVASTPQNTPGFAAITSGFGAVTQPTSCGTRTSGFASTVSAPVTSMVSAGPTGSGGFGTRVPAPHSSPTTGAFGCGSGQSGRSGLKNPFWGALKPSSLDGAGQSTPSAFHVASTPQNTPGFAAITSAFAAMTLTTSSGTSRSVVGSTTLSPIISGVSAGPAGSGGFVISMAAPNSSSTIGSFGFGSGRSGRTGLKNPFWGALNENCLGAAGQSTPSPIHMASTPQDTSGIAAITSAFAAMTLTSSSRTSTTGFGSTISVPFTSRV